jgi:hypothetical protein
MSSASASASSHIVNLAHVKEKFEAPPFPSRGKMAWPGGKITTNKNLALLKFCKRRKDRGEELTPQQLAALREALGSGEHDADAMLAMLEKRVKAAPPLRLDGEDDATPNDKPTMSGSSTGRKKKKYGNSSDLNGPSQSKRQRQQGNPSVGNTPSTTSNRKKQQQQQPQPKRRRTDAPAVASALDIEQMLSAPLVAGRR